MQRKQIIRIGLALTVAAISWVSHLVATPEAHTSAPAPTAATSSAHTSATSNTESIDDHSVTSVVAYIRAHGQLPDFYITKRAAGKLGWQPSRKNLCTVAPDRAIGGDIFTNEQRLLPVAPGRKWREADFDYICSKSRNAHRILYSTDGLVYLTTDHYKTVTEAP
jgi:guanyl-specific ribonuclease Sa